MAETKCHEDNIFLTLTYDDDHLPENNSLVKKDMQDFMKRLRKRVGKVRFFLSGEYGDTFGRPHYHLIIFGLSKNSDVFTGLTYDSKSKGWYGVCKCWDKGLCYVGNVTVDSARYVAGYVTKKLKGKGSKEYYESLGIIPEFSLMSRRPGIGAEFCDRYSTEFQNFGTVVQNGKEVPLPRYFKNRVDFVPVQADINKIKKKYNQMLGELPEHWTWSDLEDFRGTQRETNILKGMKRK